MNLIFDKDEITYAGKVPFSRIYVRSDAFGNMEVVFDDIVMELQEFLHCDRVVISEAIRTKIKEISVGRSTSTEDKR